MSRVKEAIWITTQRPENLDLVKKHGIVCRVKKERVHKISQWIIRQKKLKVRDIMKPMTKLWVMVELKILG